MVVSQWNKISLSVVTLLGYISVSAAMSTVTAYYVIVVSCSLKLCAAAGAHGDVLGSYNPLESCYHAQQF